MQTEVVAAIVTALLGLVAVALGSASLVSFRKTAERSRESREEAALALARAQQGLLEAQARQPEIDSIVAESARLREELLAHYPELEEDFQSELAQTIRSESTPDALAMRVSAIE